LTNQTKTFTRIEIDEKAKRFIEKASKGDEIHIIAHRRRFADAPKSTPGSYRSNGSTTTSRRTCVS